MIQYLFLFIRPTILESTRMMKRHVMIGIIYKHILNGNHQKLPLNKSNRCLASINSIITDRGTFR